MNDSVTEFYDRLSPEYHDNMGWDWEAGMRWQGETLDRFIVSENGSPGPFSLLDCSCGTGTQAIGLALQGYWVHATDLSRNSVECAQREAATLNVKMTFAVADFQKLESVVDQVFDVVLCCDNSIAHCLDDDDLVAALVSMKTRIQPGGLLLLSLRDYEPLVRERPRFNNQHVDDRPDGRRVVFQLWDWADDGRSYRNHQFLLRNVDDQYEVKHFETVLRTIQREEILESLRQAGYEETGWHEPEKTGYYQPIVTARNRQA